MASMKYKIITTDRFWRDLGDIFVYISDELQNPQAALRLYHRIIAKVESLETMPERGKISGRFYSVKISKYRVIYEIDKAGHKVKVFRVLYARRNLAKLLH